jgi:L-fucose isomerase-like protein
MTQLTIGLIKASLPSYFPDKHHVFDLAVSALEGLASDEEARLVVAPDVPMNGEQARKAMDALLSQGADFVILLHGGFTMGDVARTLASCDVPLGFWATPEPIHEGDIQLNNFVSLNMSMSIARGVRDIGSFPVRWYFGAPADAELLRQLRQSIQALGMQKALRGSRVGVVGGLAPTFYNMAVEEDALFTRLGVEVEHVDMHYLTQEMASFPEEPVRQELEAMAAAADFDGVSQGQMDLTARMVLALRELARANRYDALAVSDWPALQRHPGFHPGAAFSWLEEHDAIPVASEGDVMGAVTQLAVKSMTGRVGCLLDMTSPRFPEDQILMWHGGGGPLHLAEGRARWVNHPMIGRGTELGPVYGAIVDYCFAPGPVTVFRLGRSGASRFSFEAEVAKAPETGFIGCRGWVSSFAADGHARSATDVVSAVLDHGVEHHFVLFAGHWERVLAEFGEWSNLAVLDIARR